LNRWPVPTAEIANDAALTNRPVQPLGGGDQLRTASDATGDAEWLDECEGGVRGSSLVPVPGRAKTTPREVGPFRMAADRDDALDA